MPRAAALLDVMQVSEIVKVVSPDTFERPIYAGNAIETVQSTDKKKLVTVRSASFQAAGTGGNAPIEDAKPADDPGISSFVSEELSKSDRPELTAARVIISGGRAMQNKENFAKYIEPVADKLGAAVGASRAAVDAGYAPNDWQVGQTGKNVAPATTSGKNFMPRAAALLDVMQVSEIVKVVSPDTFERPIYAGNAIETVQSTDKKKLVTVRSASFQAAGTGGNAPIEDAKSADDPGLSSFVSE
jgi:electron transfer flavoprotein alpha subunit